MSVLEKPGNLDGLEARFFAIQPRQGSIAAYAVALAMMLLALFARLTIWPLDGPLMYITFFPAVALAAIVGGFGPGLFATAIGIGLASFILTPPYYSFSIDVLRTSLWSNVVFLVDGIVVSFAVAAMHRYRARLGVKLAEVAQNELRLSAINAVLTERTQEIVALNADLRSKADDANSATRAKSTFLATMSHEIRTPLNAVIGLTGLLAESPLNRRQRDYADNIQLSAQTLRALIDDVLDFSRIEAGAAPLERAPFSLNAILRTTAAVLSLGTRGKFIEVLFDVAPEVPDALLGDALRLQQLLLNLTNNASKFTEAGEIVISVRCLARAAGQVSLQFAVRDTGMGIAPEQLERIFEGFTQAEASTSRIYGGAGLGLAISSRLAGLMGGRIEVESAMERGSEFRFTLPLALADGVPPIAASAALPGLRILIVDDHPLAREILRRDCAAFGWSATALVSGPAGLVELWHSAASGCGYDLLLLDWQMPGMDGLAMLREAHAALEIALPRVILMAPTFELEQAIAASKDLCIDGMAAKPLTPASLFEAVTRAYSGEAADRVAAPGKTDRRLAGMRLLVAEDNELNQQVIEQILTRAGAAVVIADNGRAAVDALRSPDLPFDAVLMDIQMPVMDGYTATRLIREQLGLVDLPIIAVTAFARPEDREKSRRAGMVGHLAKPFDVDDLLDFLCAGCRGVAERSSAVREAALPVLQRPVLDVAAGIEAFGGDESKWRVCLREFVVSHAADIVKARALFGSGDAIAAASLVHDIGGMAGFLLAKPLAHLATATEGALRNGRAEALPGLFDELQAAMDALATSIDPPEKRREPHGEHSGQHIELALDGADLGLWDLDIPTGRCIHNPRLVTMLGYQPDEIEATVDNLLLLSNPQDVPAYGLPYYAHVKGESPSFEAEYRLRHKDGQWVWIQSRGKVVARNENGRAIRMAGTSLDVTARKESEEKRRRYASVFSHSREGIMITAADASILDVNEAFSRITGYSRDEVLGKNPRLLNSGRQEKAYYAAMWQQLRENGHWCGEVWNRRKSGEVYAELQTISAVLDSQGKVQEYVSMFSDITASKENQRQLEHIAHYDALTSLANRVLLTDRLKQAMAQTERREQKLAVAYLDLDGFKEINDTHGHEAGDQVLMALAVRMKQVLREGDTLYRVGGDEFVAVLLDLEDEADSVPLLNRLLAAAAQSVPIGDLELQVSASIGVTFYPQAEAVDADQLRRQADQAMYQAKLAGKNRYHVFNAEQDNSSGFLTKACIASAAR